jgi:hypothetical protein
MGKALAAEDPEWIDKAKRALCALGRFDKRFTSEDVRTQAGDPTHPNALGALLHWAHKNEWVERAGAMPSAREGRRGGMVAVWIGGRGLPR